MLGAAPAPNQRGIPGALRFIAEQPPSRLPVMASTLQCMATQLRLSERVIALVGEADTRAELAGAATNMWASRTRPADRAHVTNELLQFIALLQADSTTDIAAARASTLDGLDGAIATAALRPDFPWQSTCLPLASDEAVQAGAGRVFLDVASERGLRLAVRTVVDCCTTQGALKALRDIIVTTLPAKPTADLS